MRFGKILGLVGVGGVVAAVGLGLMGLSFVSAESVLSDAPLARSLAAGGAHVCAIYNQAGLIYCWGDNQSGQLGTGDNTSSLKPVAVDTSGLLGGLTVKKVAAGFAHTCVIAGQANSTASDAVYCWGAGDKGQLGNGSVADSNVPVMAGGALMSLSAGEVVGEIYAGFATTCAVVVSGGATYCWGDNDEGQYGDGTTTSSNTPVLMVSSWDGVSDLAIGMNHTCAVLNMMVFCSGAGADGQLGNQSNNDSLTPVIVPYVGHDDATSISAGFFFSCAMTARAYFYCWGDDSSGQLGGNGGTNTATLLKDLGDEKPRPIASGYAHSCVGLECIGENGSGQLGDGTTVSKSAMTAVDTSGVLNDLVVKDVSAGFDFTCWLAGDDGGLNDAVFCSGAGVDGQLGDGLGVNSSVPVAVDVSDVARQDIFILLNSDSNVINLSAMPNGSLVADSVGLNVITNNSNGYVLSVKASSADLVCSSIPTAVISPQSPDGATLAINRWGYAVGASQPNLWNGVKTTDSTIDSTGSATTDDGRDTRLWLATVVDSTVPACTYTGTITLTAVGL
jgi:alpha-tubulin suppressor-like RCC1 family protein